MAIATLTSNIRACFDTGCTTLNIYDTTGVESTANSGGWGATNINTADVTGAIITYTTPGGSPVEVDVTSAITSQTTVGCEFLLASIELPALDGDYDFSYAVTAASGTKTKTISILSLCVVRCCIDKLWAKAALGLMEEDCNCVDDKTSYTNRALVAEATYRAILSGTSCNNTNARAALLAKLQRICKLENCNC